MSDAIDVEEELCVVEIASTPDQRSFSGNSVKEMSAAEKLKSQTTLNSNKQSTSALDSTATSGASTPSTSKTSKKRKARRGSGTSSEEERWLDAIESGKLEQVDDELKKIKDPKLMTARQRAMYERSNEKEPAPGNDLLALPTGYKEKVMTAEAIQKAQLKSQKRKQLADEKREKDKRKTMDRLLKKQESKNTKANKNKSAPKPQATVPLISYRDSIEDGALLTFPADVEFPLKPRKETPAPPIINCAVCKEDRKRYSCSKTNVPLCSIKCYQINLKTFNKIAC